LQSWSDAVNSPQECRCKCGSRHGKESHRAFAAALSYCFVLLDLLKKDLEGLSRMNRTEQHCLQVVESETLRLAVPIDIDF
jgi:hypothetical protein